MIELARQNRTTPMPKTNIVAIRDAHGRYLKGPVAPAGRSDHAITNKFRVKS
jgi:hypothetical protein